MNIIKRTYDRLTGVLGYDYQGKPLRRGDLVEPAPGMDVKPIARCTMQIVRKPRRNEICISGAKPAVVLLNMDDVEIGCKNWRSLSKIDQPQLEARWENVERATGWKPQVREVEHAK